MQLEQVTARVVLARTALASWVLVKDDSGVLLVDAGYPGQQALVAASIDRIGAAPADVVAVLITHAHLDHIGAVPWLVREYGTPVYASARELRQLHGEVREMIGVRDVALNWWRPRMRRWVRALPAVLPSRDPILVPSATVFPGHGPLALPGGPVPIFTAGHTTGHVGYLLPQDRVLISGDALVSEHPTSPHRGAQLLPSWFQHDPAFASATLDEFAALDGAVDVVLPGHGPAMRGSLAELVRAARRRR